tara:strand:+ start:1218 stop:1556 length:339 start_codon:yes stop_codon:yes gene_type:complete
MIQTKNRTIGVELTTSNQDLYVVPDNYETNIKSIYINNASSSTATFSLDWYDVKQTTFYTMAEAVSMPPNSLLQITESMWLYKGDKFRGLASSNSAVTVIFNIEETFIPQRN